MEDKKAYLENVFIDEWQDVAYIIKQNHNYISKDKVNAIIEEAYKKGCEVGFLRGRKPVPTTGPGVKCYSYTDPELKDIKSKLNS